MRTITERQVREAWARLAPPRPTVVGGRGMTVDELADLWGVCRTTARMRLRALLRAGRVEKIGVRPGQNGASVYELRGEHERARRM